MKKNDLKKIKLYGIGNQETYNYYIFDKKQKTIEILSELMQKVFKAYINLYEEYDNKKDKWKRKKINFEANKDVHQKINDEPRIDIFYGDKKIYLTINCSWELRLKFNNELFKVAKMPKEKISRLKKFQYNQKR